VTQPFAVGQTVYLKRGFWNSNMRRIVYKAVPVKLVRLDEDCVLVRWDTGELTFHRFSSVYADEHIAHQAGAKEHRRL
jgi:hypothetical protein